HLLNILGATGVGTHRASGGHPATLNSPASVNGPAAPRAAAVAAGNGVNRAALVPSVPAVTGRGRKRGEHHGKGQRALNQSRHDRASVFVVPAAGTSPEGQG